MTLINRELGMDIEVWNDPEYWTTLMGKMRDSDETLYYRSARNGAIRKNFAEEHFGDLMTRTRLENGTVPTYRPDMKKIPEQLTINDITFQRWEILTIIRSGNPHLWNAE